MPDTQIIDRTKYLGAVGELLYLATASRPDLAYVASRLAQFSARPSKEHWNGFIRALRYLKQTIDLHLVYSVHPSAPAVEMFSDADFAADTLTRRSQTGCVVKVFGNVVLWQSSKQRSVSMSTLEAEYVAYARGAKNVLWITKLLQECIPGELDGAAAVSWCDNEACIFSLKDEVSRSDKLRHIDVAFRFVRELLERGTIGVDYVKSSDQVADILTKALETNANGHIVNLLGMQRVQSSLS